MPSRRAHPRVRGEHVGRPLSLAVVAGSSPRPRGARCVRPPFRLLRGLIPASAGSTVIVAPSAWSTRAHPRVRGEHPYTGTPDEPILGSSPRPRGARADHR